MKKLERSLKRTKAKVRSLKAVSSAIYPHLELLQKELEKRQREGGYED